jgi:hypothetical protein
MVSSNTMVEVGENIKQVDLQDWLLFRWWWVLLFGTGRSSS